MPSHLLSAPPALSRTLCRVFLGISPHSFGAITLVHVFGIRGNDKNNILQSRSVFLMPFSLLSAPPALSRTLCRVYLGISPHVFGAITLVHVFGIRGNDKNDSLQSRSVFLFLVRIVQISQLPPPGPLALCVKASQLATRSHMDRVSPQRLWPTLSARKMSNVPEYYNAADSDQDDWQHINSDEEDALRQPPPGEEGEFHSHAGKEAIFHEIYEKCKLGRGDSRRRSMRVQQMVDAWRSSIPSMVEAYLTLKMSGPLDSDNNPNAWTVQVVGFDECTTHLFVHSDDIQSTNATLILHGYIGASPQKVSRAFPIRRVR
ncbi:hypothetical protein K438DRAFT_1757772 [Mycena galopus ATCC 62051]|nr:hypothetical protein K438DRAFT_1757772 [Mycena galopus ATCC 62051]